jgi:hypothetical protein
VPVVLPGWDTEASGVRLFKTVRIVDRLVLRPIESGRTYTHAEL